MLASLCSSKSLLRCHTKEEVLCKFLNIFNGSNLQSVVDETYFFNSACCVCDSETFAAAVTIYRLSNDYGLTIGDSLLIPEPQMHLISVSIKDEVLRSFLSNVPTKNNKDIV